MARIGVRIGKRTLVLDRMSDEWRLWINHNADMTCGTLLELHNDGSVIRVTYEEDGTEHSVTVAPKEVE
jgi:hypothetical protein